MPQGYAEIDGNRCLPLTRVAEGGGAGVNERPVDVQSRTVTEPQRDGGPLAVVGIKNSIIE